MAVEMAAHLRRMMAVYVCFLLLGLGSAARSQLDELPSCKLKKLVLYVHQDSVPPDVTVIKSASPSGEIEGLAFGDIYTLNNILREGAANDSIALGFTKGVGAIEKDLSFYFSFTFEFTTPGCPGTLSTAGVLSPDGNGELAITGGTGTYRFARGYNEVFSVVPNAVFRNTIHLKYS